MRTRIHTLLVVLSCSACGSRAFTAGSGNTSDAQADTRANGEDVTARADDATSTMTVDGTVLPPLDANVAEAGAIDGAVSIDSGSDAANALDATDAVTVRDDTREMIDARTAVDAADVVDAVSIADARDATDAADVREAAVTGCTEGVRCGANCVDTTSDPSHCGACDTVCASGVCASGRCGCPIGLADCSGTCVSLASDTANCGGCGNACPGSANATVGAMCAGSACTFGCRGENYDVNGVASDGCEVADTDGAGHTGGTATASGSLGCSDSLSHTFYGRIASDSRAHSPAVSGFDAVAGTAPDYFSLYASGGLCVDNYSLTFHTSGGATVPSNCYRVTVRGLAVSAADTSYVTITASGSATQSVTNRTVSGGLYTDGATLVIVVEKLCTSVVARETVDYSVQLSL